MKVRDRTLLLRVMTIFDDLGVYEDGRLLMDDLRQQWQRTGFRDPDLSRALEAGVAWGVLAINEDGEAPTCTRLTRSIPPPPAAKPWWQRWWERSKDEAQIQQVGRRSRDSGQSAANRRKPG